MTTINLTEKQERALRFLAGARHGCGRDSWDVGDALGFKSNVARYGAATASSLWRKGLALKDHNIFNGALMWEASDTGRAWLAANPEAKS